MERHKIPWFQTTNQINVVKTSSNICHKPPHITSCLMVYTTYKNGDLLVGILAPFVFIYGKKNIDIKRLHLGHHHVCWLEFRDSQHSWCIFSGEITYLGLQARGYFLGITILFEAT